MSLPELSVALARHQLAWLSEEGWEEAMAMLPGASRNALYGWRQASWPATVRRHEGAPMPGRASLGVARPPDAQGGKCRIAFSVARQHLVRTALPLALDAVLAAAPDRWRSALAALDCATRDDGIALRVFGSLALQHLSGERYMSDASDIDLLHYPADAAQLARCIALLASYADRLPLDGEVVFPDGRAVSWKEWRMAMQSPSQPRVLTKSLDAVQLTSPASLLATFARS